MTFEQAYAELVGGNKHVHATPSRSFIAVLDALRYLGRSYNYKIAQHACVSQQDTGEIIARMQRLALVGPARRSPGWPGPGQGRIYFELTPAGRRLASLPRRAKP